jgi:hypothetical protein
VKRQTWLDKVVRAQGGVDKFHSATAGGKNRQFEEAK